MTRGPTYIWGAMFPESSGTEVFRGLAGQALRDQLLTRFHQQGWGNRTLEVIERTDPEASASSGSTRRRPGRSSWHRGRQGRSPPSATPCTPPRRPPGWERGRPSGMPRTCSSKLVEVRDHRQTLAVAVSAFEADMRLRGSEVVTWP